jgi:hypothetical protein
MKTVYIPIGMNCNTAHYLRSRNLRKDAYPFDWICIPLKMVYEVLSDDFNDILDNIHIGTQVKRMYFDEKDNNNSLSVIDTYIYPVICQKYNILYPHDYDNVDIETINNVKDKYNRRIQRFRDTLNSDSKIVLVYCDLNQKLNPWQQSCYTEGGIDHEPLYEAGNQEYIQKIQNLYKNVSVISLDELKILLR